MSTTTTRKRSRSTDRLLQRLREEGLRIPDDAVIERTRAGRWQRMRGAWSWYVVDAATGLEATPAVGSPETVAACLAAGRLHVFGRDYREVGPA